eukprot:Blabericola_migrator_1__10467@NODE_592_length_7441_cov_40_703011_g145_i3_p8_GENE_NODE_592_length_7441_cov_40_703011_g145_i3NODE_592_length_7441_cov_40_703011_g145_i3_p8_ORF_typecomplete_len106_score9_23PRMT5_C/PF17286_2/0_11_NODE_592_length_7441_cov_40_703011_g145_i347755092
MVPQPQTEILVLWRDTFFEIAACSCVKKQSKIHIYFSRKFEAGKNPLKSRHESVTGSQWIIATLSRCVCMFRCNNSMDGEANSKILKWEISNSMPERMPKCLSSI